MNNAQTAALVAIIVACGIAAGGFFAGGRYSVAAGGQTFYIVDRFDGRVAWTCVAGVCLREPR